MGGGGQLQHLREEEADACLGVLSGNWVMYTLERVQCAEWNLIPMLNSVVLVRKVLSSFMIMKDL